MSKKKAKGTKHRQTQACVNGGPKTKRPMTESIEISPPPPVEVSKI